MSWLTINVISRECTFHMNGLYNTFSHEWNRDKLKICYRELYLFYSRNVNIKTLIVSHDISLDNMKSGLVIYTTSVNIGFSLTLVFLYILLKLKICYRELYLFYSRNVNIKWIMLCNCDEVEKYVLWHHDNELLFYIRHIRFISRTNARMSLLFI
jgi:hypothetical protein